MVCRHEFLSAYAFADDVSASCFIPFVFSGALFYRHACGLMVDGYIGAYLHGLPFISMESIFDTPLTYYKQLTLQWKCMRDPVFMDELYERGRQFGEQHVDKRAYVTSLLRATIV